MRVILVGASGTLGRAIAQALEGRHEIIRASRSHGDVEVDIASMASVQRMYEQVGRFDAVVCAAGQVRFAPLAELTPDDHAFGLQDKLMGQVNLVSAGLHRIADGGSFTLVSGVLARDPIRGGASATLVNAALEGFVRAAAIELPRGVRINAVSPTVFRESLAAYGSAFAGFQPVGVADAALAFVKSVEGAQTGQVYRVG